MDKVLQGEEILAFMKDGLGLGDVDDTLYDFDEARELARELGGRCGDTDNLWTWTEVKCICPLLPNPISVETEEEEEGET